MVVFEAACEQQTDYTGKVTDPLLVLLPDDIQVWLAFYGEITDEQLLSQYRHLLTFEEKEQEQRFYFAEDKRRYLVTRAMVRTVLSRYAAIDPERWEFVANAYGRPEIANVELSKERLFFNLSHTRSLIVLAVAKHRDVGVDVENVTAREVSIDIANRFFSTEEVLALGEVPRNQQQYRFFEYWTFKEAYIKARGMGLSLPLDKFGFHYPDDGAVEIAIHPCLNDDPSRWLFWQFRPAPQYLLALCAERSDSKPCKVVVRKVVPAVKEEVLAIMPTRSSLHVRRNR